MVPALSLDLATATEIEGVANRRGYRTHQGRDGPWLSRRSATAPGMLWLCGAGPHGPFFAATDHAGVAAEIPNLAMGLHHPGIAAWHADTIQALDALVDTIYRLSVSLPAHPLALFRARLAEEPVRPTEAEAVRRFRIGQDVFRAALLDYWGGVCPLTGIKEAPLLRASHIRPWAECDDAERLDVYNGLLLSALWDAAFDRGLVSFDDAGVALFAPSLGAAARQALAVRAIAPAIGGLRPQHAVRLVEHRRRHGFAEGGIADL